MTDTPAPAVAPSIKRFGGSYLLHKSSTPRVRHRTMGQAEAEAGRLCAANPGETFIVTQEVARVKLKPAEQANG